MKANKAQIISDRMRRVTSGSYAPSFEEETPKVKRNPYDSPYSNLPRYHGRIKWQTMSLNSKSKGIYLKIRKILTKKIRFLTKKRAKTKKEIIEYPDRFTSL